MSYLSTVVKTMAVALTALMVLVACSRGASEGPQVAEQLVPSKAPTAIASSPEASPAVKTAPLQTVPSPAAPVVTAITPPASAISPETPTPGANAVEWSEPPDRDLFDLAYRFGKIDEKASPVGVVGASLKVGHSESFFVNDLVDNTTYTIQATLRVVSENAYWYVDDAVVLSDEDLSKAADIFETEIRLGMVESLGDIRSPGVDGDPHLTVLHTPLRAAAGYFGSSDQYPQTIHPHSNQREMIYMSSVHLKPGATSYMSVLAHELQHAIHWNLDGGEDAWINEGMSEFAKSQEGYDLSFVDSFLGRSDVQIDFWPDEIGTSGPHYGASSLFLTYLSQHYGGYQSMGNLVRDSADGITGIENYLSAYDITFEEVFKRWAMANYLDADSGPYGYPDRSVKVRDLRLVFAETNETDTLPQFAARYYDLQLPDGDYLVKFSGNETVPVVNTSCLSGKRCWWSGNGDSIDSMLTREVDLTGLTHATLEYWVWYDIEKGWDYAYASVSTDGGERWNILKGSYTTDEDPVGNNFGHGYTGASGQWFRESIDISKFAGQRILLRFEYVTDDAVNLDGFVIDDIGVPELGLLDEAETASKWNASGFQLIDNALPQRFALQIIENGLDGSAVVREVVLNDGRSGQEVIAGIGTTLKDAVLVVTPLTPGTFRPAEYRLSIAVATRR